MSGYAHDYTYFIYCPHCGQMKIGGTDAPHRRLNQLDAEHRATCPMIWPWPHRQRLRLIAACWDNQQPYFHRQFRVLWVYGEWYLYTEAMRARLLALGAEHLPDVPPWRPDMAARRLGQPNVRRTGHTSPWRTPRSSLRRCGGSTCGRRRRLRIADRSNKGGTADGDPA
jgi:hypothetical protein